MGSPLFNGKINLLSAVDVGSNQWDVEFSFFDAEGAFQGTSVLVGDRLIFDTSILELGSVTKYKLIAIVSQTESNIIGRIEFDDTNSTPPDLSWVVGFDAIIARPTPNQHLSIVPSPSIQQTPEKLSIYPINFNWETLDVNSSGTTSLTDSPVVIYTVNSVVGSFDIDIRISYSTNKFHRLKAEGLRMNGIWEIGNMTSQGDNDSGFVLNINDSTGEITGELGSTLTGVAKWTIHQELL